MEDYERGRSTSNTENLNHMCKVAEIIGSKFQYEFISSICKRFITPYQEVFSNSQNSTLENTERRYGWLARNLKDFVNIYDSVIPRYWGIKCHIINEFIGITRI